MVGRVLRNKALLRQSIEGRMKVTPAKYLEMTRAVEDREGWRAASRKQMRETCYVKKKLFL